MRMCDVRVQCPSGKYHQGKQCLKYTQPDIIWNQLWNVHVSLQL